MTQDSSRLAKQFIDGSIKGKSKPPSRAAYARAVRMAREAIEELTHVAHRAEKRL